MMHGDDEGNARPFAAGLILGALIGAGVALLFAPQSGAETRRIIRKRAKHLAADASDRFDDVKDRIKKARRRAEDVLSG
jgi:gas vesicle protein